MADRDKPTKTEVRCAICDEERGHALHNGPLKGIPAVLPPYHAFVPAREANNG